MRKIGIMIVKIVEIILNLKLQLISPIPELKTIFRILNLSITRDEIITVNTS
jgi:hypothetical protein